MYYIGNHCFNYVCKILLCLTIVSQLFADTTASYLPVSFTWQKEISQKKNKTILDYYLLLPTEYLDCENLKSGFPSVAERKTLCKLIDEKNGYIKFFNAAEIALFKNRKDSTDFIVLQIGKCGAGSTCGGVNTILQFLPLKNCWVKREELLPEGFIFEELYDKYADEEKCPYFKLPQKGLVVEVRDENSGLVLERLKWNGERFRLE